MDKVRSDIKEHENQLRNAMLSADVVMLDRLLSSDLIFTNHFGQIISKEDDLKLHRQGILKIDEIELSEQTILILENAGVVTVRAKILGSFEGKQSESVFRFTRVWRNILNDVWQVVVGHSCMVA